MDARPYRTAGLGIATRRVLGVVVAGACLVGVNFVAGRFGRTSVNATEAQRRGAEAAATCTSCHDMGDGYTHPIDISPSMRVPTSLPLTEGRVTCETCHDPAQASGHAVRAGSGRMFLRLDNPGSLCIACHVEGGARGSHGTASLRAHLARSDIRGVSAGLDNESRACIGCHDGVTASDAGAHPVLRSEGMGEDSELGSDHPVGVVQEEAFGGVGSARLKSPRMVDPRVRLFGKTVGCGSCHSVYAKNESLLVMSNHESALCVSCHAM